MVEEKTATNVPFRPDEYPGLKVRYWRVANAGLILGLLVVALPGYSVYFWKIQTESYWAAQTLIEYCQLCRLRYEDLQNYDGISGSVYIVALPLFLISVVVVYVGLLLVYLQARLRSTSPPVVYKGVRRNVILFILSLVVLISVVIFIPTDLHGNPYPGMSQLLACHSYPLLAGGLATPVALLMMQLTVFFMKIFR